MTGLLTLAGDWAGPSVCDWMTPIRVTPARVPPTRTPTTDNRNGCTMDSFPLHHENYHPGGREPAFRRHLRQPAVDRPATGSSANAVQANPTAAFHDAGTSRSRTGASIRTMSSSGPAWLVVPATGASYSGVVATPCSRTTRPMPS